MPRRRRARSGAEDVLPEATFRREVVYRSADERAGVKAAGFLLKPDRRRDVIDQTSPEYVAVYLLRGAGEYVDREGRRYPLRAGDVFQRLPGRRHSNYVVPDGTWAECYVVLDADFFAALARLGSVDADRPVLSPGIHRSLVDRVEQILRDLQSAAVRVPPQTLLRAHELIVDIYGLDAARRAPDPYAASMRAACALLGERLDEHVSLPEIAESFHMGYERFRKVFRDRVGVAPGEYRIRRRIERACRLLVQEPTTAKQIAYALGYPDAYSFSKQFRAVMGVSPDAFRRGAR